MEKHKKMVVCKPRERPGTDPFSSAPSEGNNPANTLLFGLLASRKGDDKCLLFKTLSLCVVLYYGNPRKRIQGLRHLLCGLDL